MRGPNGQLGVAVDASALADGRRFAGIGRYADELLRGLRQLDRRVALQVCIPPDPARSDRWLYRYARNQPRMAAVATRARPDLIHGLSSEASICFPLGRQVVTVHDAVPWANVSGLSRDARAYLRLQHMLLRRAGAIIVPSQAVVGEVASTLGVDEHRITAIEHGVSAVFSPHPRADDELTRSDAGVGGSPYLIWVGSLHGPDPRKGLDVLFEALGILGSGSAPLLALVGKHGQGSEWARQLARKAKVKLTLPGYIDDSRLAALYRGAAAAVVPSRHEGFGLPALEAMACGAPVIVTDAGNSPAVVGSAAVVVPQNDAAALAHAVRAVVEDRTLSERLSAAGPARASAFSWQRAAERTLEVYERVAAQVASKRRE